MPESEEKLRALYAALAVSEAGHLLAELSQRAIEQLLDRLGVHALGYRRVSGEVGEQDRDLTALLREWLGRFGGGRRWGGGDLTARVCGRKGGPAFDAELGAGRALSPAAGAMRRELRAAGHAEASPLGVLGTTAGTRSLHPGTTLRRVRRG